MFDLARLFARPLGALRELGARPPAQPLELIHGGPNAPQLACRPVDYKPGMLPRSAAAEVKLDGICALHIDGRIVTLEGQPFDAALHCLPGLQQLEQMLGGPMFFHAEYVENVDDLDGYEATLRAFRRKVGAGTLWVHDAVPIGEWRENQATDSYRHRKAKLIGALERLEFPFVGGLGAFPVADAGELFDKFGEVRRHHWEGLVIKDMDAPYRRERCKDWLRLKVVESIDLRLLEVAGNDKTGASRLILEDVGGPCIVTQGMNAEVKLEIWRNREVLTGTENIKPILVEVEHNGRTGHGKLRHARFKRVRMDRAPLREED